MVTYGQTFPISQWDWNQWSDFTLQVIPFSIAIKRMSEILLYKANECTAKLNTASEVVTQVTFSVTDNDNAKDNDNVPDSDNANDNDNSHDNDNCINEKVTVCGSIIQDKIIVAWSRLVWPTSPAIYWQ